VGKKSKDTTDFAAQVEGYTEEETLRELDAVKDRICTRAKNISQEEQTQAEKRKVMKDYINLMKEDFENDIILQSELENHLRRLSAGVK
jgi:hypothetical protein